MDLHPEQPTYLSLFSGVGGGDLAAQHLKGLRCVGYVERDPYCQRVIRARIADGWLDDAPIWDDVDTFDGPPWRGLVDGIFAGFPCPSFSVAGKGLAGEDPRNKWPSTIRIIREVRPRFVFLENVPGLLSGSHGYFGTVLGELASAGFDAQWCVLSAEDVGAPHIRKRVWVLAAHPQRDPLRVVKQWRPRRRTRGVCDEGQSESRHDGGPRDAADSDCRARRNKPNGCDGATRSPWGSWSVEPVLYGMDARLAHRVDRLRATGNGQVPIVAATAWHLLRGGFE